MFAKIIHSSMFHFFTAGAVIFGLYQFWGDKPQESKRNQIYITSEEQKNIEALLTKTKQRPPSKQELQNAIDELIDETIFYKEAINIGLDEDDVVVRRRLAQKLKFIIGDLSISEPTEDEISAFYAENKEKYKQDASYMFNQIYFENLPQNPKMILQEIHQKESAKRMGDVIDIPYGFKNAPATRIQQIFGVDFENALKEAELKQWFGPISSVYGYHYVNLLERKEAFYPSMDEIRTSLSDDWRWQQQNKAKITFINDMRKKYHIVVEPIEE